MFSIHWWCTQNQPPPNLAGPKTLCCPRSVRMSSFQAASSVHHLAQLPPETHPSEDLEGETTTQPTGGFHPQVSHAGEHPPFTLGFFVKKWDVYISNIYIYAYIYIWHIYNIVTLPFRHIGFAMFQKTTAFVSLAKLSTPKIRYRGSLIVYNHCFLVGGSNPIQQY